MCFLKNIVMFSRSVSTVVRGYGRMPAWSVAMHSVGQSSSAEPSPKQQLVVPTSASLPVSSSPFSVLVDLVPRAACCSDYHQKSFGVGQMPVHCRSVRAVPARCPSAPCFFCFLHVGLHILALVRLCRPKIRLPSPLVQTSHSIIQHPC